MAAAACSGLSPKAASGRLCCAATVSEQCRKNARACGLPFVLPIPPVLSLAGPASALHILHSQDAQRQGLAVDVAALQGLQLTISCLMSLFAALRKPGQPPA
jgi:hypothetical protein